MQTIESLCNSGTQRQGSDGKWYPAVPLGDSPLLWRLRDAWAVLKGQAVALEVG